MKILVKILKWFLITIGIVVVVLTVVVSMRQNLKFDAPYPEIKISKDSVVIARGKYLVYGPAHCAVCHTTNAQMEAVDKGEILPLAGGHVFKIPIGELYSKNITPDMETGIGKLTDQEIARTLRYGVGSDGRALIDLMPFHNMAEDDLTAVISFLRVSEPVKNVVPENKYNLLGKIVKAFMIIPAPMEGEIPKHVEPGPTVEYGKYLVWNVANCRGCHTNRDLKTGKYIGKDFAGGLKLADETKDKSFFVSPNLTADDKTGALSHWTEEQFIKRFRQGRILPGSPMPWGPFSRMTEDDLKAIYAYVKTIPAINNDTGPRIIVEN